MKILGIETSCDDTAAAVIEAKGGFSKPSFSVLSNISYSQVAIHKKFGGIVPDLASRAHLEKIIPTIKEALRAAKTKSDDIDLIAVTRGPGLMPSLLIGVNTARALAYRFRKPIIGVNHIEGHIYSNWLANKKIEFPALVLVVSGGHTELVLMSARGGSAFGGRNPIRYKIIGQTVDDAAGECFDKTARLLGLGFPGGPAIAQLAEQWKTNLKTTNYQLKTNLPRPMINSDNYNFSFSGLKTAVLYLYNDLNTDLNTDFIPALANEIQSAIVDVLTSKTLKAIKNLNPKTVMLAGGVSANAYLREEMARKIKPYNIPLIVPGLAYTTDNAAMIAIAGYLNYLKKKPTAEAWKKIEANANLRI
ncbi:MAG: tRNA (adenosine(37)-N6)-threonylcarbamoyltransferase complex transferase subunit TsaD [Candidatus Azambacteria bacterium]|nr:tRNA (adenosine(37)-N6)-threonylcarbamoyltransferase complex transferase subunit TsaD [Candidatus Azambacteria bacterium]